MEGCSLSLEASKSAAGYFRDFMYLKSPRDERERVGLVLVEHA